MVFLRSYACNIRGPICADSLSGAPGFDFSVGERFQISEAELVSGVKVVALLEYPDSSMFFGGADESPIVTRHSFPLGCPQNHQAESGPQGVWVQTPSTAESHVPMFFRVPFSGQHDTGGYLWLPLVTKSRVL